METVMHLILQNALLIGAILFLVPLGLFGMHVEQKRFYSSQERLEEYLGTYWKSLDGTNPTNPFHCQDTIEEAWGHLANKNWREFKSLVKIPLSIWLPWDSLYNGRDFNSTKAMCIRHMHGTTLPQADSPPLSKEEGLATFLVMSYFKDVATHHSLNIVEEPDILTWDNWVYRCCTKSGGEWYTLDTFLTTCQARIDKCSNHLLAERLEKLIATLSPPNS